MKAFEIEDNFLHQVEIDFSYLLNEFGFTIDSIERKGSHILINFLNKPLIVKIMYDLRDEIIFINLSNVINDVVSDNNDEKNSIALVDLVRYFDPEYNINQLLPIQCDFSKPLKENAKMLLKYGREILKGKKIIAFEKGDYPAQNAIKK